MSGSTGRIVFRTVCKSEVVLGLCLFRSGVSLAAYSERAVPPLVDHPVEEIILALHGGHPGRVEQHAKPFSFWKREGEHK